MRILVIHGPNLNLLGARKPDIYGTDTLEQINDKIKESARSGGVEVVFFQSNHEGAIIDRIQQALRPNSKESYDALVINPGAYTHYSYAIRDAIEAANVPTIEVHLSDIHNREPFRATSVIAPVCREQIVGLGVDGYIRAVERLLNLS